MDIPDAIKDSVFEGNIKPGYVLKTQLLCNDGVERPHYFITLTESDLETQVFVVTTSKIDFYNRNPSFNRDILIIPQGSLSYFPKETVVDCRKITKLGKEILKERYRDGTLIFIGILPDNLLKQTREIIRSSRFISRVDKKLILEDY